MNLPVKRDCWARYDQSTSRWVIDEGCKTEATKAAQVGMCRTFVRLWDTDLGCGHKCTVPGGGWARGQIMRSSQPIFVLTSLGPMWDPTDPSTWRPGL